MFKTKDRNKKTYFHPEKYEQRYEQSSTRPLKFLIKRNCLPKILLTIHTGKVFISDSFNKEDVMESLIEIKITERGNRRVENESVLELLPVTEFHQSFTVTGIDRCLHISIVTSERFWVSDVNNGLILSNTAGETLHQDCWLNVDGPDDIYNGLHTVNNDGELIYIDSDQCIYKLSNDGCMLPFVKKAGSK